MKESTCSRSICVFHLFFLLLLSPLGLISQEPGNKEFTPLGMASGAPDGSQVLSEAERINLYTGNFSYSLSLLEVAGRGDIEVPLNLNIEQHWKIFAAGGTGIFHPDEFLASQNPNIFQKKIRYNPGNLVAKYSAAGTRTCGQPIQTQVIRTLMQLFFTGPDGTEFTLVDKQSQGQAYDHPSCYSSYSRGREFVTTDGTSATFVSDTPLVESTPSFFSFFVGEPHPVQGGYLMLRDGTKYRIEQGVATWMTDRNGNRMDFTYIQDPLYPSEKKLTQINDSLSRTVDIEYDVQDVSPYGLCDRITYKGFSGSSRTIRISKKDISEVLRSGYTPASIYQLFGVTSYTWPYPNRLPSAVWLPDGLQSYKFFYNQYSELARVESPTGGAVEYDYDVGAVGGGNGVICYEEEYRIYRRLVERRVYPDGSTISKRNSYSRPETAAANCNVNNFTNAGHVTSDTFDGLGALLKREKHFFYTYNGGVAKSFFTKPVYYYSSWPTPIVDSWKDGKEYKTEIIGSDGTTLLRRTEFEWQQQQPYWWTGSAIEAPIRDPKLVSTVTTLGDTNQVSRITSINPNNPNDIGFDQFNNQTDLYEYDFGNGQPGGLVRRTHTDYVSSQTYVSEYGPHLRSLPSQVWVSSDSAGNNKLSLTQYEYDNYSAGVASAPLMSRNDVSGFDAINFSGAYTTRGNVTATISYQNGQAQSGIIKSYSQYDILGNVVKSIDPNGNTTTFSYSDNFGSPDGEARTNTAPAQLNGLCTFAFATSSTNPLGWTTYSQYDLEGSNEIGHKNLLE